MAGDWILYTLILAFILMAALIALIVIRVQKEGFTVTATPRGEHFKRSIEEVQKRIEVEHATHSVAADASESESHGDIKFARYGFGCEVSMGFDEAIERVTAALKEEGFGVLTDIDVAATMKAKLQKDMPPYRILGACNPPLASRALDAEPSIGLLLPCNVVVRQDLSDAIHVEFMDPVSVIGMVQRPGVDEVAQAVRTRLLRVVQSL